ncbi:MAG TPA: glycoside hydrolase family 3 N-terminal domain-containing protein [Micromonosporaceae bacterium]|nr:glycoside hydrolase family 3 N-terminal domain-containing protein [Micromonosporaceae bacterium]
MTGMDQALHRLALGAMLASFPGTTPPAWAERLLEEGLAGYVLFGYNVAAPDQLRDLVSRLRTVRPDVIVGIDEEGGDVTRLAHAEGSHYPGNAALGAADDTDLTREVYRAIGNELHDLGINLNLAPDVDVNTSDENPIIGTRSFGTDPGLVARHAAAAVAGLQSAGVAACAKHFPGHGATVADSHAELPTVDASPDLLRERELPPFVAAIEAGARAVMTAHIRIPALTGDGPATLSRRVLTDLLRGQLGFSGAVLTDALEMRGASAGIGIPETAVRALAAGADVLCIGAKVDADLMATTAAAVVAAVREGRIPTSRLEQAVERTTALAATPPASGPGISPAQAFHLAVSAARRALRVEGSLPRLDGPLLVQIDSPATIAAGELPWGIAPYLDNGLGNGAAADLVRVRPDDGTTAERLLASGRDRQILVVSRDTHRHRFARDLVTQLTAHHRDVVLVEMGWPAAWRPEGLRAYLATYGSSRANARAAAEALLAR